MLLRHHHAAGHLVVAAGVRRWPGRASGGGPHGQHSRSEQMHLRASPRVQKVCSCTHACRAWCQMCGGDRLHPRPGHATLGHAAKKSKFRALDTSSTAPKAKHTRRCHETGTQQQARGGKENACVRTPRAAAKRIYALEHKNAQTGGQVIRGGCKRASRSTPKHDLRWARTSSRRENAPYHANDGAHKFHHPSTSCRLRCCCCCRCHVSSSCAGRP